MFPIIAQDPTIWQFYTDIAIPRKMVIQFDFFGLS